MQFCWRGQGWFGVACDLRLANPKPHAAARATGSWLKETASTERHSVQAPVPEQALNKRDSVPVPFGRTDLDLEFSKEMGGSAEESGRDRLD